MPAPLLLVDDDLATIAQVKRLLARQGYEMVLATNAADAVIAWGHHLPALVLISPKVESNRGRVVLEELRGHPDAKLLHVLLLGETIPGFGYPVAPLPLEPEAFAQTVSELIQGTSAPDGWQVRVAPSTRTDELPAVTLPENPEPEDWRATRRPSVPGRSVAPEQPALFSTPDADPPPAAPEPPPARAQTEDLESTLFGDLEAEVAREVEAEAMASVDASLARLPIDQELQDLEDDVRAEAARRRKRRHSSAQLPAVGLPTPDRQPPGQTHQPEDPFASFDEPSTAAEGESGLASRGEGDRDRAVAREADGRAEGDRAPDHDRARAAEGGAGSKTDGEGGGDRAESRKTARELELDTEVDLERENELAARLAAQSQTAKATLARAAEIVKLAEAAKTADQQRQLDRALARQLERDAAQQALEAAEADAAHERAERERVVSELRERGASSEGEAKQLWGEVERLEQALKQTTTQLEQKASAASQLDAQLAEAQALIQSRSQSAAALELQLAQARASANARAVQLEAAITATDAERNSSAEAAEALALRLSQAREGSAELQGMLETTRAESAATGERLEREKAARLVLEQERATLEQERAALQQQHAALQAELGTLNTQSQELSAAAQRAAGELREAIEEAEQSEARAQQSQLELQQAQAEAAAHAAEVATAKAEAEAMRLRSLEAEAGLEQLRAEVEKLREDFTTAHQSQRNLEEALEDARAANLEVRTRVDVAETRARFLEEKSVLPLKAPHRAAVTVARFGTADLGELARLVGQVVLSRSELRLELAAAGGRRTLWFDRGAVSAAESTFGGESLLDRARHDGLIDARQTGELQMLRTATPAEAVVVLKQRGLLREGELVPLVQRYTEQVALDAFSEPTSEYRLAEEGPGKETLAATLPRPTLPLVAEALRRALPVEELLERLGGSEAVPKTIESELDLRALGFADKERRMLGYCDGEATIEDLALASGLKADVAFRALLVARLLGLISIEVPERTSVAATPQLDVKRLEAKFEQVQDADYFTMLGLGRAAGGDEVTRAWQRLAEEFDPLRYSGHPDAGLQQRAQVVYSVLEEAARALGDDRRRAEYARHLVD